MLHLYVGTWWIWLIIDPTWFTFEEFSFQFSTYNSRYFFESLQQTRPSFRAALPSIRVIERSLSLAARLQLLEITSHAIARYIEECVCNCFQLSFQLRQRTPLVILFRYIYFHYLLMENRIQLHHTILRYGFQLIGTLYIVRRHRSIIIRRKIKLTSALQRTFGI